MRSIAIWPASSGWFGGNVDMATADVLVVAPDTAFRNSIAFALESGGFSVALHRHMHEGFMSPRARGAACAVVDDDAIDDWKLAREQFDSFAKPVIVLVSLFRSVPDFPVAMCLTKPFLGEPLIDAVSNLIASQQ